MTSIRDVVFYDLQQTAEHIHQMKIANKGFGGKRDEAMKTAYSRYVGQKRHASICLTAIKILSVAKKTNCPLDEEIPLPLFDHIREEMKKDVVVSCGTMRSAYTLHARHGQARVIFNSAYKMLKKYAKILSKDASYYANVDKWIVQRNAEKERSKIEVIQKAGMIQNVFAK